jgi:glycosyltransferase involved in cell wall biosynthesis
MNSSFDNLRAKKTKLIFYFGGFASVGGIETFCKNILLYLQKKNYICKLLCWGKSSSLIKKLSAEEIVVIRSSWRWGCKYNLPDWLLLPLGVLQIRSAEIVVFGKLFPIGILKLLRFQSNKQTKFVYVTPYRPSVPNNNLDKQECLEMMNLFDLIIVQASIFSKDLRDIGYRGRIEILSYIPQDSSEINPLPITEEVKIGFLGRLVEDKNIPLLLKSFKTLQQKYLSQSLASPNKTLATSLHIFGDGHLRQELEQLAQNLDIKDSVTFYGDIPNSQVNETIASCHLFAFTSNTEGQCLAALEILACGRPIVATEAGALPDILSDSRLGKLVRSNSPEDIAFSILELINLLKNDIMTSENVRSAYLERYDSNKIGDRYLEIFNSLETNKWT